MFGMLTLFLVFIWFLFVFFQGIKVDSYRGSFIKTYPNPSPMVTLDNLGESIVPTLNISSIEEMHVISLGGGGGGGCSFV